jgi:hypothetical protein
MEQTAKPGLVLLTAEPLQLAKGYTRVKPLGRLWPGHQLEKP